jgi:hypothetical protein
MTVSKLKVLKREVEAAIHAKVAERRHEIESELSKLSRFDGGGRALRGEARGIVAAKYRNPRPTPKAAKKLDDSVPANSPNPSTPKISKTRKRREAASSAKLASADHIEPLPIEPLPIEPPSVASIHTGVVPADVGVAA